MLQDDAQPKPSTEGREDPEDKGVDESMEYEESDLNKNKGKSGTSRQNMKLYEAEGILNPKMKKAEKRSKKANRSRADATDGDYDFKVDYTKKGTAMDADGSEAEDDDQVIGAVPISGINLEE
ncbi:guanine nucleotide-binding protein-like NSN1 [Quillaja saponaria]|nr:guanine nucleotide-binding protein-like NSN1 [Quillaja saponaria]